MSDGNGQTEGRSERFRRSVRLLHEGRAQEAGEMLEELYERYPDDTEVALNLGGAYILQHRYDAALPILEKAAKGEPDNENVWVNLAAARLGPLEHSDEEQQAQAIEAYERALSANPEVANVHYMLGLIYRRRDDDLRAAAHFTRALEQNPQDNDARRMLRSIATNTIRKSGNSEVGSEQE